MSRKSSADDQEVGSQQEILLVNAGKTLLKKNSFLISTINNAAIEVCAVDDQDVESQQPSLLNAGNTQRRWWHLVYLVQKAHQKLVSAANNTEMDTQLASTELLDTGEPEPIRELGINRGFINHEATVFFGKDHEATVVVLQTENIAKMVMEKDSTTLQHFGGVQGIAEALNSDMVNGIPGHEEDLPWRRTAILKPKSEAHNSNFIHFLRKSCNSSTIFLLLIFSILSFAFRIQEKGLRTGWYEGALTLGAVILIVIVHSICEFRKSSRQLSRNDLRQNGEQKVHVLRGGHRQIICISDVLVGDIVLLEKGDRVPADGLLIPTESLEVNDKADPIINDQNPFLFYGSRVADGTGKMLVTSVGAETKLGNILSRAPPLKKTPVEKQLNKLSTSTQITSIVISIIILVVLFLQFKLEKEYDKSDLPEFSGKPHPLKGLYEAIKRVFSTQGMINTLTSSCTLLLVGVAEGLALAITIAITCWNKRMLGDKIFAQEPSITVTMASVTIICTDETGGLTLTPHEVERCWIGEEVISEDFKISEAFCDGIGILSLLPENSRTSVDNSILSWAAEKWGLKTDIWKQSHSIIKWPTQKDIVEAVIGKDGGKGPRYWHCRGPATAILDMCSHFYDIEGNIRTMDRNEKIIFEGRINQMLSKDNESIALARKQVDDSRYDEGNLTMLGLLGLKKNSLKDTTEVIKECREAGVKVLLVSSEEVSMLQNIATAFGVIQPDSDEPVISGAEFRNRSDEERMDMAARISVMGSSLPSDRLLLLSCLKDRGHTVAVVGNRTNDIPMLKAADVGLTFATWSTIIARKSTDIIIMEGKFTSILAIMKCGRCIFSSMQKYLQFQLTMTLAGLLIPLITDASHGSSPITTIQLHWAISVLTLLGGLALLMEPPSEMLTKKFTLEQDGQLITKAMWVNIFIQIAYQVSLLATIQSKGPTILRLNKKVIETVIFNSFFLCQVFNIFNAREPEKKNIFRGVHRSQWFWVGIVAALLLQVGFLEIAHIIAGDSRLTYAEWGMCLLLGIISWCIDLAGKCTLQMIKKWVINSAVLILSFHSCWKLKAQNVLRNSDGKTE
ncbi:calcium-transporting ATPase 12, plasma membrane-type-like [Syzygium oleosum]|uniref:calcium-transporting ATPase 12, plasma membrane-type-like n=1 Tax=Syzygium oleosum TaxID=219896 RepID=UPI0024BBAA73|nr:calcium-transporting ATPase 12, plasma membrane-type-like [Syzygium oleosum]